MMVSEDGKTLIETPFDECRSAAWKLVHEWLEVCPGKIAIVDSDTTGTLVHRVAVAIWDAKGRPMPPIRRPPT